MKKKVSFILFLWILSLGSQVEAQDISHSMDFYSISSIQGDAVGKGEEQNPSPQKDIAVSQIFMPLVFRGERLSEKKEVALTPSSLCKLQYDDSALKRLAYRNQLEHSVMDYAMKHHPECVRYTSSTLPSLDNTSFMENTQSLEALNVSELIPISTQITLQEEKVKPKKWVIHSDHTLQLSQGWNSNNWMGATQSSKNFSLISVQSATINYDSYQKFRWETMLSWRLDFSSTNSDSVHSYNINDDLFRIETKLLYQAIKNFNYLLLTTFTTPIFTQYKKESEDIKQTFLSPMAISVGLGMNCTIENESKTLKIEPMFNPLSIYWKYVRSTRMDSPNQSDPTRRSYVDVGYAFGAYLTWAITRNIEWNARLYAFSDFERTLIEFENTFKFVVNRFLSAICYIYPRFDDKDVSRKRFHDTYFQLKESVSLGLNISF